MTVEIADPSNPVTITDAARQHFLDQCRQSGKAILLKLKESGCTGYMYVLELVDKPPQGAVELALGDGAAFCLDSDTLPLMRGTEIDYVRNGLNLELQFNNPNAREFCGCGESFSIDAAAQ